MNNKIAVSLFLFFAIFMKTNCSKSAPVAVFHGLGDSVINFIFMPLFLFSVSFLA